MKFPTYLYYELLVRLADFRSDVGNYQSSWCTETLVLIKTDQGTLETTPDLMDRQFKDPRTISQQEIMGLAGRFQQGKIGKQIETA